MIQQYFFFSILKFKSRVNLLNRSFVYVQIFKLHTSVLLEDYVCIISVCENSKFILVTSTLYLLPTIFMYTRYLLSQSIIFIPMIQKNYPTSPVTICRIVSIYSLFFCNSVKTSSFTSFNFVVKSLNLSTNFWTCSFCLFTFSTFACTAVTSTSSVISI